MARLTVLIGKEFEIQGVEIEDASSVDNLTRTQGEWLRNKFRQTLTIWMLSAAAIALVTATIIGVYDGSFDEVGSVWKAIGWPLGLIMGAYFDRPK